MDGVPTYPEWAEKIINERVPGGPHLKGVISQKQILDFVKSNKCCKLLFVGHRGGEANPGGFVTIVEKPYTCPIEYETRRVLPNPILEFSLKEAFKNNGCSTTPGSCKIDMHSCETGVGSASNIIAQATCQAIADRTKCYVRKTCRPVRQGEELDSEDYITAGPVGGNLGGITPEPIPGFQRPPVLE